MRYRWGADHYRVLAFCPAAHRLKKPGSPFAPRVGMVRVCRFLSYWLPVFILAAIIFFQSSFATPDVLPRWPCLDKFMHAGVFGLLSALIYRAFNSLPRWHDRIWPLIVASTLLSTLYGLSDEWHQSYVPHRSSEAADLLADLVGSSLGAFIYQRADALLKRLKVTVV